MIKVRPYERDILTNFLPSSRAITPFTRAVVIGAFVGIVITTLWEIQAERVTGGSSADVEFVRGYLAVASVFAFPFVAIGLAVFVLRVALLFRRRLGCKWARPMALI